MELTQDQIDKVGNTLIYLHQKIGFLSKTKALKLLYLIEEKAVERFGHQILHLEFEVWEKGPVDRQIFIELSNDSPRVLAPYISLEKFEEDKTQIIPSAPFCDDEFSQADLALITDIIEEYGNKTAEELISITHKKGSLWETRAQKVKWKFFFKRSTTERIDFTDLLQNDKRKLSIFHQHKEATEFKATLKKS